MNDGDQLIPTRRPMDIMTPIAEMSAEYSVGSIYMSTSKKRLEDQLHGILPLDAVPEEVPEEEEEEEEEEDVLPNNSFLGFTSLAVPAVEVGIQQCADENNVDGQRTWIAPKLMRKLAKDQVESLDDVIHIDAEFIHQDLIVGKELTNDYFSPIFIEKCLGAGGFASVYLAYNLEREEDEFVVKVDSVASAWEFYIIQALQHRLDVDNSASIICASAAVVFNNASLLFLEHRPEPTLLQVINDCQPQGGMDELLVAYFTAELLRTITHIHSVEIIHGDLKADNVLVRLSSELDSDWSSQYDPSGKNGWSSKGILLIDFGKSFDRKLLPQVHSLVSNLSEISDILDDRLTRPWLYDIDYVGLASIIYCMLFGKYLDPIHGDLEGWLAECRFKRYWNVELWKDCFTCLLSDNQYNPEGLLQKLDSHLLQHCDRNGKSLKAMLRQLVVKYC
jgi:hypothetical protein